MPISSATLRAASCFAPSHWPPTSIVTEGSVSSGVLPVRPPTRGADSKTTTSQDSSLASNRSAAAKPAGPAPITATSFLAIMGTKACVGCTITAEIHADYVWELHRQYGSLKNYQNFPPDELARNANFNCNFIRHYVLNCLLQSVSRVLLFVECFDSAYQQAQRREKSACYLATPVCSPKVRCFIAVKLPAHPLRCHSIGDDR